MSRAKPSDPLRCSFCNKTQDEVGKLISAPCGDPHAYICDECVFVCLSIIADARLPGPQAPPCQGERPSHCLMCHPQASELLHFVELWIVQELEGGDAALQINAVRVTARLMMGLPPA